MTDYETLKIKYDAVVRSNEILKRQIVGDECKLCTGPVDENNKCTECGEDLTPIDAPSYEWMDSAYRHWFNEYLRVNKERKRLEAENEKIRKERIDLKNNRDWILEKAEERMNSLAKADRLNREAQEKIERLERELAYWKATFKNYSEMYSVEKGAKLKLQAENAQIRAALENDQVVFKTEFGRLMINKETELTAARAEVERYRHIVDEEAKEVERLKELVERDIGGGAFDAIVAERDKFRTALEKIAEQDDHDLDAPIARKALEGET